MEWKFMAAASETRVNLNVKWKCSVLVINLLALVFMQITQVTLFMHLTMTHEHCTEKNNYETRRNLFINEEANARAREELSNADPLYSRGACVILYVRSALCKLEKRIACN
jgi:hypothetical protein